MTTLRHVIADCLAKSRFAALAAALLVALAGLMALSVTMRHEGLTTHVHVDPGGLRSMEEVRASGESEWVRVVGRAANLGYSDSAFWFKVQLPAWEQGSRFLEIGYPLLGNIDLHAFSADGKVLLGHQLGADRRFGDRPVFHYNFVLELEHAASGGTVLMRVHTRSAVQVPIGLWAPDRFAVHQQRLMLFHGGYIGLAVAMLIYHLLLSIGIGERAYLWYVCWVACFGLFIVTLSGLSFQWLWPESPQWNLTSLPIMLCLAIFSGCGFFLTFMRRPGEHLKGELGIRALACLALLVALAALWLPYRAAIMAAIAVSVVTMGASLPIAIPLALKGHVAARHFLIAFTFVMVGGGVLALSKFGVLPRNLLTELAPELGAAIQMLMLSLAMAARINADRRLREEAQAELIEGQRQANLQLEDRVLERTRELNELNERLEAISRTDGLTGVFNRRHLDECLGDELRRARRAGAAIALLLIDVDHFKNLNDSYGHQVGDECLKALAATLRGASQRSTDLVARYGGEEFCVLAPNSDETGAYQLAEAIRQKVEDLEIATGTLRLGITVSIGVCWRKVSDECSEAGLLALADQALYRAKAEGRNRVVLA